MIQQNSNNNNSNKFTPNKSTNKNLTTSKMQSINKIILMKLK